MNNIYDIQDCKMLGVAIPYSNAWKSVAVMVSGGADSALLSYLICNHIKENNLNCSVEIISAIRCWKTRPWQRYSSLAVYKYLVENFNTLSIHRNEVYIPPVLEHGSEGNLYKDEWGNDASGDSVILTSYAEYLCNEKSIQAVYNAVTKNPPEEIVPGGLNKRYHPEESIITQRNAITVLQPFKHIDKKQLFKIYTNNNLQDFFDITRSCEGEFANIDYTNYTPYQLVPTCDECFWCKERKWAQDV